MLDAQINAATRTLTWWDWRFGPSLVAVARSCLTGTSKTVLFNWGKVAFRSTPGSTQIIADAAAVAFVEKMWKPAKKAKVSIPFAAPASVEPK